MGKFIFEWTDVEGVCVVTSQIFGDKRGGFMETYNREAFCEAGIDAVFLQDNQYLHLNHLNEDTEEEDNFDDKEIVLNILKDILSKDKNYLKDIEIDDIDKFENPKLVLDKEFCTNNLYLKEYLNDKDLKVFGIGLYAYIDEELKDIQEK